MVARCLMSTFGSWAKVFLLIKKGATCSLIVICCFLPKFVFSSEIYLFSSKLDKAYISFCNLLVAIVLPILLISSFIFLLIYGFNELKDSTNNQGGTCQFDNNLIVGIAAHCAFIPIIFFGSLRILSIEFPENSFFKKFSSPTNENSISNMEERYENKYSNSIPKNNLNAFFGNIDSLNIVQDSKDTDHYKLERDNDIP